MNLRKKILELESGGVDLVSILGGDLNISPDDLGKILTCLPAGSKDFLYSELLYFLIHRHFSEEEAQKLWNLVIRHKKKLNHQLNRNVGFHVALLDYMSNKQAFLSGVKFVSGEDYKTLLDRADFDDLTKVYNRRYFEEHLLHEIERARRYTSKLSLLMLDLDNFKLYNDTRGHIAGDLGLKSVAESFMKTVRTIDYVCRYGGDEFAIICPGTVKHDALTLAERLCAKVKGLNLKPDLKSFVEPLTLSVGVATWPDDAEESIELVKKADKALYNAKKESDRLDSLKREQGNSLS